MSSQALGWKIGVEVELVAPAGLSRADLARETAGRLAGVARRIFHPQAEPGAAPGVPVFETLTHGFAVSDDRGFQVARFVDDFTLRDDLDPAAPAKPGWFRIATDDARIARLMTRHCDPDAPLETVLEPACALFGGRIDTGEGGMRRLDDPHGAPVALAAPQTGERERACEIITAPLDDDHLHRLDTLLAPARALGFLAPREGAVHLHFDAAPLCDARILQRLLRVLEEHRAALRAVCGANPRCRRLGPDTAEVLETAFAEGFAGLSWPDAVRALKRAEPTKYCDFNIRNLVNAPPGKHTLEIRILGPGLDAALIVERAALFEALLRLAAGDAPLAGAARLIEGRTPTCPSFHRELSEPAGR